MSTSRSRSTSPLGVFQVEPSATIQDSPVVLLYRWHHKFRKAYSAYVANIAWSGESHFRNKPSLPKGQALPPPPPPAPPPAPPPGPPIHLTGNSELPSLSVI